MQHKIRAFADREGEESAVLLRDCTPMQALMVLDDLRTVDPDSQTFSVGIAEWDGQEGPERLVGRADRALYEAKQAGRDRIIAAPSPSGRHPDTQATGPIQPETAPPSTQIDTKTH